jgi:hypothetical protein
MRPIRFLERSAGRTLKKRPPGWAAFHAIIPGGKISRG